MTWILRPCMEEAQKAIPIIRHWIKGERQRILRRAIVPAWDELGLDQVNYMKY